MHLHHHGRTIHTPGKISDLPLPHIVHLVQAATTSAALKPPVNRLAPHPQFQRLRLFVQFVPIHPVPRPRQNRSPFFVRQLLSVPKKAISLNHRYLKVFPNSCGEPHFVSNSVSARDSSAAPGGGIYMTGGYNPTWILRLPGGRTLSSRSRCPIASIGHPRCACQLYECRKSTNSSAASPALQWSWIFPLIVPTYGCTSTPSLVSLTTLSGLLHDLSPH